MLQTVHMHLHDDVTTQAVMCSDRVTSDELVACRRLDLSRWQQHGENGRC